MRVHFFISTLLTLLFTLTTSAQDYDSIAVIKWLMTAF